jgi:hypothetical protein
MSNTTNAAATRVEPRPPLSSKAQRSAPVFRSEPSGLSREELQKLLTEMIR